MKILKKFNLPIANPSKTLPISKIGLLKAAAQIAPPIVKIMLAPTMTFLRPKISDAVPATRDPIPAIPKLFHLKLSAPLPGVIATISSFQISVIGIMPLFFST